MPGYRAHLMAGLGSVAVALFVATLFGYYFPLWWCVQAVVAALVGSLFPDIDIKSKGQKLLYMLVVLAVLGLCSMACYAYAALLSVCSFVPLIVDHRALFHSFWFICVGTMLLVCTGMCWFPSYRFLLAWWGTFFIIGVFSHLVLDFGLRKTLRRFW